MPRLAIFAPCERVIIGQGDNSVSLIGVIQNFTLNPAPQVSQAIPSDLILPMNWAIFTMWQQEPDDEGVSYTQRVSLIAPSGRTVAEAITSFVIEKESHRVVNGMLGLPAGEAGLYNLRLTLRRDAGSWKEVAAYPFTIKHPSSVMSPLRTQ